MLTIIASLTGCANQEIALIGGADGPTVIFVTEKINWLGIIGVMIGIVFAIIAVVYFFRKKK